MVPLGTSLSSWLRDGDSAVRGQVGAAHQGPDGDGGEAVHQGVTDAAADAGEEEQVW